MRTSNSSTKNVYSTPSINTLHRIRHGEAINTKTINTFCEILNCKVEDIIEYIPED